MAERSMGDQEMIDVLEDIARNGGNAAARIAAIKTLREIAASEKAPAEGRASLYEVSNPGRIRAKAG